MILPHKKEAYKLFYPLHLRKMKNIDSIKGYDLILGDYKQTQGKNSSTFSALFFRVKTLTPQYFQLCYGYDIRGCDMSAVHMPKRRM